MHIIHSISSFFFDLPEAAPPTLVVFVAFGMAGDSSPENHRAKLSYVTLGSAWAPSLGASVSACMEGGVFVDLGTRISRMGLEVGCAVETRTRRRFTVPTAAEGCPGKGTNGP